MKKKAPKVKKGYVVGGTVKEYNPEDVLKKDNGKSLKDATTKEIAGDFLRNAADQSLSGIGAQDVIKNEDYKTTVGRNVEKNLSIADAASKQVGAAVVNYYVPELGTKILAGQQGVGQLVGEDTTGLKDKQTRGTIDKINTVGTAANSAFSMSGISKENPKGAFGGIFAKKDKSTLPKTTNVDAELNSMQIDQGANEPNLLQPLPAKRTFDSKTFDISTIQQEAAKNEYIIAKDDVAKQAVLDKYNIGYKDGGRINTSSKKEKVKSKTQGGVIKGKGGEKDDAINMLAEENGFIVPAEYAEEAKVIRSKYFGNPTKKAPLKSGNEEIMVSNNETYFTEDENNFLKTIGIDLNALAPNAKTSNAMKEGGVVGADPTQEAIIKARSKNKQEADKKAKKEQIELDKRDAEIWSNYVANTKYELANPKLSKSDKAQLEVKLKNQEARLSEIQGRLKTSTAQPESKPFSTSSTVKANKSDANVFNALNPLSDLSVAQKVKQEQGQTTPAGASTTKSVPKGGATKKTTAPASTGIESLLMNDKNLGSDENGNLVSKNPDAKKTVAETPSYLGAVGTGITKLESGPTPAVQQTPVAPTPQPKKFDWTRGVGAVQTGLGIMSLIKDGTAPTYSPNAQLSTDADILREQSQYGYNPATMSRAYQNIELGRRTANREALGQTGGSEGTQLAFMMGNTQAANQGIADLLDKSEYFRLGKQKLSFEADKVMAQEGKYAFESNLNLFDKRQMAGATLTRTGIENMIGAQRYQDELAATTERKNIANAPDKGFTSMSEDDFVNRWSELTPYEKTKYGNKYSTFKQSVS